MRNHWQSLAAVYQSIQKFQLIQSWLIDFWKTFPQCFKSRVYFLRKQFIFVLKVGIMSVFSEGAIHFHAKLQTTNTKIKSHSKSTSQVGGRKWDQQKMSTKSDMGREGDVFKMVMPLAQIFFMFISPATQFFLPSDLIGLCHSEQ